MKVFNKVKKISQSILIFSAAFAIIGMTLLYLVNSKVLNMSVSEIFSLTDFSSELLKQNSELYVYSNNLTDYARSFVVTKDFKYALLYFTEEKKYNSRKDFLKDIHDLYKRASFQLSYVDAEPNIELMQNIEYKAMALVASIFESGPKELSKTILSTEEKQLSNEQKVLKAQNLIFGNEYLNAKNLVEKPIDDLFRNQTIRVSEMSKNGQKKIDTIYIRQIHIVCLTIFVAYLVTLFYWLFITKPLLSYYQVLSNKNNRLPKLIPQGVRELRLFAEAFNNKTQEIIGYINTLRRYEKRMQIHMDHTSLGVIDFDANKRIIGWNPTAEKIFGFSKNEVYGKKWSELLCSYDNDRRVNDNLTNSEYSNEGRTVLLENIRKDGKKIICEWYNTPIYDGTFFSGWMNIVNDVTEERKRSELNQYLSAYDVLTNIYNRRFMQNKVEEEHTLSLQKGMTYSLLMMDIDHFKKFNDSYGHECGDEILSNIGKLIRLNLRELDIPSRWGGEEFLILLPSTTLHGAKEVAEKIRNEIAKNEFVYDNEIFHVTVTIGIATEKNELFGKDVIRKADRALYIGKEEGRNRIAIDSGTY